MLKLIKYCLKLNWSKKWTERPFVAQKINGRHNDNIGYICIPVSASFSKHKLTAIDWQIQLINWGEHTAVLLQCRGEGKFNSGIQIVATVSLSLDNHCWC